jgi:predicted O-linked N-acetylglucosamine transferase (SPINDLY family)
VHTKTKICNWTDIEDSLLKIHQSITLDKKIIDPFISLGLFNDISLQKKAAEININFKYPYNPILGDITKRSKGPKIRLGYYSGDFYNHATGQLIAELFELHDKNKFEIFGISFGPTINDEMSKRLKNSFTECIEVGNQSDLDVAKLSRKLNIDIAVDLKGLTENSRTGIFSYRAAPIQVNYLGYPGTMGAKFIDYIIADKILIPEELQKGYSEKIIYLPNSYQVNGKNRLISKKEFSKKELGLPENSFIYCSFNNNYKIQPRTFASWMRILKGVEGSILWLFKDNEWVVDNLKKELLRHGINDNRLIFAERMPLSEHLARHRCADLFLDTFPCNAHTTASDALWAGLPILTLTGHSFASRVAASLLNAIGLSNLIVNTEEEYESLAIELGNNPQKIDTIKKILEKNKFVFPLFDTIKFTRNIETAYIKIYERYQANKQPENIIIN